MEKRGIVILVVILIFLIFITAIVLVNKSGKEPAGGGECYIDSDCTPASCCHATSCILKIQAPDCSQAFCSQECSPGTLDCGQGSCKCIQGKCSAQIN